MANCLVQIRYLQSDMLKTPCGNSWSTGCIATGIFDEQANATEFKDNTCLAVDLRRGQDVGPEGRPIKVRRDFTRSGLNMQVVKLGGDRNMFTIIYRRLLWLHHKHQTCRRGCSGASIFTRNHRIASAGGREQAMSETGHWVAAYEKAPPDGKPGRLCR